MWFAEHAIPLYLLILCRVMAVMMFAPVFSSQRIPMQAKIALSLFLSVFIHSSLTHITPIEMTPLSFGMRIVGEMVMGYALAGILQLIFAAVEMTGSLWGLQMGFGMASIFDPNSGQQSDVLGQMYSVWAGVLFLTLNGHHRLLEALVRSFEWVEPGQVVLSAKAAALFMQAFGGIFPALLKLAGPLLVSLWLAGAAMAIISRFLPTLNIFLMDFPVKAIVGFTVMGLTLQRFASVFGSLLTQTWLDMRQLILVLHGG